MKKLFILLLTVLITFTGCKKTEQENPEIPEEPIVEEEPVFTNGGFYYNWLNEEEKAAYAAIYKSFSNFEKDVKLDGITVEQLERVWYGLRYDHPEFFWMSQTYYYSSSLMSKSITSVNVEMDDNVQEIYAQIEEIGNSVIAETAGMSTYEIINHIYCWIINNTVFNAAENNQDIRSVFLNHESVCNGYASAFQYLCNKAGIECLTVTGYADEDTHAWNEANIDGQYYWFDTTWSDPVGEQDVLNYNYFCLTDDEINLHHRIDNPYFPEITYPAAVDGSLNYYRQIGAWFDDFVEEEVAAYITDKLNNGEYTFYLRFAYEEAARAFDAYLQSELFSNLMQDYMSANDWNEYSCQYSYDDKIHQFTMYMNLE